MNQDRDKKFLALTLMYLPIFFSIILESVKKNVAKKKEKYETRRILFPTLILQKTKTVVRKHHYCLFGCWNIIRRRMVWQKVMDFFFVCLFVFVLERSKYRFVKVIFLIKNMYQFLKGIMFFFLSTFHVSLVFQGLSSNSASTRKHYCLKYNHYTITLHFFIGPAKWMQKVT